MKKYLLLLTVLFVSLSFNSCSLDDDGTNVKYGTLSIIKAELPEAFEINKTYDIKVTYLRPNSCYYFEGFDVVKEDLTQRKIVAVGTEFLDKVCTESVEEVETVLKFVVLYNETYTFRFWNGTNEAGENIFIEYTVPVTPPVNAQ